MDWLYAVIAAVAVLAAIFIVARRIFPPDTP
jgi:hypothetical protein